MRNVWTIARREYHRFFTSPIAYVVAFVMLLTLGIMFSDHDPVLSTERAGRRLRCTDRART